MEDFKFYVIGGQYERYNYGGAKTLHAAKKMATAHREHWDNWQGWHKPEIYLAKDCVKANTFFGEQMVPAQGAIPASVWDDDMWIDIGAIE